MEAVEHRDVTMDDAERLAANMRKADADECIAASGLTPFAAVVKSIERSEERKALYLHGELAAIYGVVPIETEARGRHGVVWMLTTYAVERHPEALIQATWETVPELLERWDTLTNAIDCRHVQALKWGYRIGFQFAPPEPVGKSMFCRFIVRKEDLPRV